MAPRRLDSRFYAKSAGVQRRGSGLVHGRLHEHDNSHPTPAVSRPLRRGLPGPTAQQDDHRLAYLCRHPHSHRAGRGVRWDLAVVHDTGSTVAAGAGGLLFFGPLLMIVFRQKYPRWWFDWNLELQRFTNRVSAYLALMDDRYPSTTDHQSVHLDYDYPDAARDLNRWLPLVKWFLAIPHYIVLALLNIVAVVGVIVAWFAILFTGKYPRSIFDFVAGVLRWNNRVLGYAFTLVTDRYPPFSLS
ncbi:MAG: hypothetical protein QOD72_2087 [Acidimicrobiaceae bacterium]|nr:hypothetical protein [Acidimicrobiaceae bacterium]